MSVRRSALLTAVGAAVFLALSALLVFLTFHAGQRVVLTGDSHGPRLVCVTNPWFLAIGYLAMVLLGAFWIDCMTHVKDPPG